jgi:hypothetical protein
VAAELKAHGGKNFGGEIAFAARCEALEERRGQDRRGGSRFDRRENGPAAFARIRDAAGETLKRRLFQKRDGGEIEQPGGDNAAAAPNFGDVGEIEIILIVFGIAKWCSFRIVLALSFSGVRRKRP